MRLEDILDQQKQAHKYYGTIYGINELQNILEIIGRHASVIPSEWNEQIYSIIHQASRGLYYGDCCFVTSDILDIALTASVDLPEAFISKQELLCRNGFMLWEHEIQFEAAEDVEVFSVDGMMWIYDPSIRWGTDGEGNPIVGEGLHLFLLWEVNGQIRIVHWYPLELDAHIEFTGEKGSLETVVFLFVSLMLLSKQTLSEVRSERASRAARRRVSDWRPNPGYISVITLRRKSVKLDGDNKRDFQYRFIVNGHWRRQWYPSLEKHQWKYIHEYVKGPDDKPLIIRDKRVFNFRR